MATQVNIKFISEGFREILLGSGVQGVVQNASEKIQANANANLTEESNGFSVHTWQGNYGGGRWIGSVSTTDSASCREEAENKALSKAVK